MTTLGYALPREGSVRLVILDAQGRRVATLVNGVRSAGPHTASWTARSDAGHSVPAGVYVAVLEHEGRKTTRRIVHLP